MTDFLSCFTYILTLFDLLSDRANLVCYFCNIFSKGGPGWTCLQKLNFVLTSKLLEKLVVFRPHFCAKNFSAVNTSLMTATQKCFPKHKIISYCVKLHCRKIHAKLLG